MASNLTFGLVTISEGNEILVLLAQTIVLFLYIVLFLWLVRIHFEGKALYFVQSVHIAHLLAREVR